MRTAGAGSTASMAAMKSVCGERSCVSVTGPIVAHSGPLAALHTANGLYAVVFIMCFVLGFVTRHRQHNAVASH